MSALDAAESYFTGLALAVADALADGKAITPDSYLGMSLAAAAKAYDEAKAVAR